MNNRVITVLAASAIGDALIIALIVLFVYAIVAALRNGLEVAHGGDSAYESYDFAAKYTRWGNGFWMDGSHPDIVNEDDAKLYNFK